MISIILNHSFVVPFTTTHNVHSSSVQALENCITPAGYIDVQQLKPFDYLKHSTLFP